ncbi:MAG TPA: hypothetical protein VEB59_01000 [Gemmatimonadales bacterium]|nr:hypothetical protein [Gemmatimonadales bacterium]
MQRHPLGLLTASLFAFATGVAVVLVAHGLVSSGKGDDVPLVDLEVVRRAQVIAMDDLPDAAIAVFDSLAPKIYLNTRLLARIGPDLAAFLRAHEEGHLVYHHVPERRFGLVRVETPTPVLHSYEFAADCYAAQVLRRERPASVQAAIRFFQQRRDVVTDSAHPSMGARADQLIDCLTDPARSLRIVHRR